MLVSVRLSKKFGIPSDLALLYDFVNSLDVRRFVERGAAHDPSDELATPAQLREWLRTRGLLEGGVNVSKAEHREALRLREALRAFIAAPRRARSSAMGSLVTSAGGFPLELAVAADRAPGLRPVAGRATSGLGQVLVELVRLSDDGRLERLKTCDSDECRWIFYDRSKPSNRRWCSSELCGNREKTRTYRSRRGGATG
ncbi:MAG TPA: CGNR zinc finger domain-containing protein [Pseudolabrys sp.]|nr:CGNR zinc finger domain-containing protein [Pseudolabrys sp.]